MRRSRVADGECLQGRVLGFGLELVFPVFEEDEEAAEDLRGFGVKEEEGGMVKKKKKKRLCMLTRDLGFLGHTRTPLCFGVFFSSTLSLCFKTGLTDELTGDPADSRFRLIKNKIKFIQLKS
jgi:hypothetical protein